MSKSAMTITIPGRDPDEPGLTSKQRSFIFRLVEETGTKGLSSNYIDTLGKWQASAMIDRLIAIRDGITNDKVEVHGPEATSKTGGNFKILVVLVLILAVIYFWNTR